MPFTLTMPKLSPTMDEGMIVKWHKKEGDYVEAGDVLLEVATDKATVEHQALDEGWLRQIIVQEGSEAAVNDPIAVMTEEQNESLEGYQIKKESVPLKEEKTVEEDHLDKEVPAAPSEGTAVESSKGGRVLSQPQFVPEIPMESVDFEFPTERLEKRVLASPLAKKLAREKGVELSTVKGSGPNHRVLKRDVDKAQPSGIAHFNQRETPSVPSGSFKEIPLSPIRKVVGQRLQDAKTFIPHFYVTQCIDAEPLAAAREQLKVHGIKVSVNDFIVRGCALALREHPEINSGFHSTNQTIVQFQTIDISVAVSIDQGLVTPIVRHADYKNLGELSIEIRSLVQKAREGKLEPKDYKGGSFTISNMGMYGVTEFQAILNPPQAAILAVSSIQDVPVVRNGNIAVGKTMNLTLSVDHRAVDGAEAARFLQTLKKILENPAVILVF